MFGVVFFGRITRTKMHYCGDKVRKCYKPFGLICVVFAFCIGATAQAVNSPRVFASDQMEKFMNFLNDDVAKVRK